MYKTEARTWVDILPQPPQPCNSAPESNLPCHIDP